MNDNNIINGWEYLTPIKPTEEVLEQKLQTDYLVQYNLAYKTFIESICINSENLEKIVNELLSFCNSFQVFRLKLLSL